MKNAIPVVAVGVGVALVALSAVWPLVFPASSGWTEDKAQRMADLSGEAHQLLFKAAAAKRTPGADPVAAKKAYESAKAELETLNTEFESSRDAPQTVSFWLRWTGIGLTLVGGMAVMMAGEG